MQRAAVYREILLRLGNGIEEQPAKVIATPGIIFKPTLLADFAPPDFRNYVLKGEIFVRTPTPWRKRRH